MKMSVATTTDPREPSQATTTDQPNTPKAMEFVHFVSPGSSRSHLRSRLPTPDSDESYPHHDPLDT